MSIVRSRFAPSPTGFMHVGNLRTALYSYLLARANHGKFILRIEDTDQARYVEAATEVIYKTLRSAGLEHDEGPDKGGEYGPYIQSERKDIYIKYARQLVEKQHAYYCFCDKHEEDDAQDSESAHPTLGGCPGHCAELSPEEVAAKLNAGAPYVIRQRIPRDGGATSFTDAVFGEVSIEHKVLDDQILLKRDGMPTYNFANVIDDHLMQITHVVRGCEYISSTPKYKLLYEAFGWEVPVYVHLPLIMGKDAAGNVAKLSKRHGSVCFENLVEEGYLPEAIVNYIALLGWSSKSDRELFTLSELEEVFQLSGLNKAQAIFDYAKLRWMNGEYIKKLSPEKFETLAHPFAKLTGTPLEAQFSKIAALLQNRVELLSEIPSMIGFLQELPDYDNALFCHKKSKSAPETALEDLKALRPVLSDCAWTPEAIMNAISEYATQAEVKAGRPMWAARIAVSGLAVTPGGPGEIMEILGREESLRRLDLALQKLQA